MTRTTSTAITTACVSMAVGAAAYMIAGNKSVINRSKKLRKTTGKALRQVGDFIGNVSYMMK